MVATTNVGMSDLALLLINIPLAVLSLTVNVFFACSLIFPPRGGQKLKQPLKTLLGFLVCGEINYFLCIIIMNCVLQVTKNPDAGFVLWLMARYFVYMSMTSYVWLNFYYHTQIVPARRAVSMWVKKNIRSIIYTVLFLDRSVSLFDAMMSVSLVRMWGNNNDSFYVNGTSSGAVIVEIYLVSMVRYSVVAGYATLCLCVTSFSSISTVHYLRTHMRSLAMSGGDGDGGGPSLSSRRFRGQMRVTVTGTIQGLLYLLFELWSQFNLLSYTFYLGFAMGARVTYTFSTLQMCGTTITMAVGQTVFRQKAADVWTALKSFFGFFVCGCVSTARQEMM